MTPMGDGHTRLEYEITTRCLFGFQSEFLTLTKGPGLFSTVLINIYLLLNILVEDEMACSLPWMPGRQPATQLTVCRTGCAFPSSREEVYTGMIVGENKRTMTWL